MKLGVEFDIGFPATAYGAWHQFGAVEESLAGKSNPAAMVVTKDGAANGASATVAATDIPRPQRRPEKVTTWRG